MVVPHLFPFFDALRQARREWLHVDRLRLAYRVRMGVLERPPVAVAQR